MIVIIDGLPLSLSNQKKQDALSPSLSPTQFLYILSDSYLLAKGITNTTNLLESFRLKFVYLLVER